MVTQISVDNGQVSLAVMFCYDIYQGSFGHVKVAPTPVLALHNLWRQIHMFLNILEFRAEHNYLEKNCFVNVVSDLLKNGLNYT